MAGLKCGRRLASQELSRNLLATDHPTGHVRWSLDKSHKNINGVVELGCGGKSRDLLGFLDDDANIDIGIS
jgi:hypothetical protein